MKIPKKLTLHPHQILTIPTVFIAITPYLSQIGDSYYSDIVEFLLLDMNFRTALCICALGWIFLGNVHAQKSIEDIRASLDSIPNNREKISELIDVSRDIITQHPKDAVLIAQDALKLSQKLKNREGVVNSYSNIGQIYMNLDQYGEAKSNLTKSIDLKNQLLKRKANQQINLSQAKDYRKLGICEEKIGSPQLAEAAYHQATLFGIKARNTEEVAYAYNSLGEVQIKLNNYSKANESFSRSLSMAKKEGLSKLILTIEKNMATSGTLLKKDQEVQEYQANVEVFEMEADAIEEEIASIKESLDQVEDSKQTLIKEKDLLALERDKKESELEAKEMELLSIASDLRAKEADLRAKEADERNYLIAAAGAGAVVFLIILGLISRSRARKKAAKALAKEKQRSDELLYNILPAKTAKEILQTGKATAHEYRNATIIFTDFVGFTAIAAKMKPDELIKELGYVFEEFDQIIEKHNLEKIKTIGDGYMAVSGLPTPAKDHAISAVAAALDMQAFMHRWKVEKERNRNPKANKTPWELRIGVHSGTVVAGVIGKKRISYDIWGDAVNVASRVESSGEAWEVNISEATYKLVRDECSCVHRGKISVKNRGEVDMYFAKQMIRQPASRATVTS